MLLSEFDVFSQVAGFSLRLLGILHLTFGSLGELGMFLMHALQVLMPFTLSAVPVSGSLHFICSGVQVMSHIPQSPLLRLTSQFMHGLDLLHGLGEFTVKWLNAGLCTGLELGLAGRNWLWARCLLRRALLRALR